MGKTKRTMGEDIPFAGYINPHIGGELALPKKLTLTTDGEQKAHGDLMTLGGVPMLPKTLLYQKIFNIFSGLAKQKLDKTGANPLWRGTKHFTHEELSRVVGSLFIEQRLLFIVSDITLNERDFESSGKNYVRTVADIALRIVDIDTGYEETFYTSGADQDTGGKSSGQATTEAIKRWFLKTFMITEHGEEDPDNKSTEIPVAKPETKTPVKEEGVTRIFSKEVFSDFLKRCKKETEEKGTRGGGCTAGKDLFIRVTGQEPTSNMSELTDLAISNIIEFVAQE